MSFEVLSHCSFCGSYGLMSGRYFPVKRLVTPPLGRSRDVRCVRLGFVHLQHKVTLELTLECQKCFSKWPRTFNSGLCRSVCQSFAWDSRSIGKACRAHLAGCQNPVILASLRATDWKGRDQKTRVSLLLVTWLRNAQWLVEALIFKKFYFTWTISCLNSCTVSSIID